jgi:RecJ-like exonuclease
VKIEKVPKAAGADARTVAELHAQKTALKEKTVSIRGKVVKFNAQIMGKNWLHLQDGSGDPKAGTHDITVTSADTVKVGDLVTIKGTVRLKKDFGAGYAYEVIVEDARVSH